MAVLAVGAQLTLLLVQQPAREALGIRLQQVRHKEITEALPPVPVLITVVGAEAELLRLAVMVVAPLVVTVETVLPHLFLAALIPTQVVVGEALLMAAQQAPAVRAVVAMQEQVRRPH